MKVLISVYIFFITLSISSINASVISINYGEVKRDAAKLYLPKNFSNEEKLPLIISLHGYGGSQNLQNWYIRLKKYVSKSGFMLLLPNGMESKNGKRFWNASNFCCDFEKSQIDDLSYIKGLISQIDKKRNLAKVDRSQIYVVGYSNGAFMAHKMACDINSEVAGIVTISGTSDLRDSNQELIDTSLSLCEHNRSIKHLHIHGTEDKTILYNGHDNEQTGYLGVDDYMKLWSKQNNCAAVKDESKLMNITNFKFGKESDLFKWKNCDSKLELLKVNHSGHFVIYKKKLARKIIDFLLN